MRSIEQLLVEAKRGSDRQRTTIYLSKSVFDEARRKCKEVSVSRLIEAFLKDFANKEAARCSTERVKS